MQETTCKQIFGGGVGEGSGGEINVSCIQI